MREGGCRLEGERVKAEPSWRSEVTERTFAFIMKILNAESSGWRRLLWFRAKEKNNAGSNFLPKSALPYQTSSFSRKYTQYSRCPGVLPIVYPVRTRFLGPIHV